MIPYGRQNISEEDIDAVVRVLKSEYLTQGPFLPQFEETLANKVCAKYAIAVNSATSALHLACLALGLGKNDWLWTSPNTFVASANCALYCGAKVDFVDIDPLTYNMNMEALEHKLKNVEYKSQLPKIVIPVHFAGQSCDMASLRRLSGQYGFRIIEDASHAVGAFYRGMPVGCGQYSDITIFSFHPVKIMTTGEGGIAVTNHAALADRMALLRTHGITRDAQLMRNTPDGSWYYEQHVLGFNYRMTEIQAALGLSQLKRLDQFVNRRQYLAMRYNEILKDLPIILPHQHVDTMSSFHLYVIQIDTQKTNVSRNEIFDDLRNAKIQVNVHYIPVHFQPYYQNEGFYKGQFPVAEEYYARAITLPLFFDLEERQQDDVIRVLERSLL